MVVVCSQLSHLTFGDKDGTLIFSTLIWLVALTPFEVDLSLTTRLTRGGCILRLDQGYPGQWRKEHLRHHTVDYPSKLK